MSNGQINIVSVPAVMQLVTQEPTVPVDVSTDGVQQNSGVFAGLLSGIQSLAKEKASPDSGQAEQVEIEKAKISLDAGTEDPAVDLLALLQISPQIIPASEFDAPKAADPEKADVCTDAVPMNSEHSENSDVASQMALAAYSQPGRMPEVNIPTPLHVDVLQNVATVTEQPAVVSAPPIEKATIQMTAEPHSAEAVTVPAKDSQPAKADRTSDVNNLTTLTVDTLQNVATVKEQPALFPASSDKIPVEQTPSERVQTLPLQTTVTPSATTAIVPEPDEQIVLQVAKTADLPAIPAEKPIAASITLQTLQSEQSSVLPTAPATPAAPAAASTPESELEILLSQPQPITARVSAATVIADKRPAVPAPEMHGVRQRLNPELKSEEIRTDTEQSKMASSLQTAVSASESTMSSDTSSDSGSNQEQQPDNVSDNRMLEQMRGQLNADHHKVATVATKAAPTVSIRQDIPEQVMHQVKERLGQYDVKPGNQQITLTLSPDSLGELKMNLNLQGQKLSVEIITENKTVRDVIVQHTDALKESLARQNITMESFDVTTGGKGSGNQGQNQNAWRELAKQQEHQQFWASSRGYHIAQADLPSGKAAYQRQQGQSMLDIHY